MDEPTTGLHLEDIRKLAEVFDRLVDAGHTLVLIEHNLDVIKLADWVIDLGPEAGVGGGQVVAMGRPEEVARRCGVAHGTMAARPCWHVRRSLSIQATGRGLARAEPVACSSSFSGSPAPGAPSS